MVRKTAGLGRVLLILSSVFLLSSCSFQDPEVTSFDGIDVIKMEENNAEVDINITLNNPNSQALKLKKAEFDILINSIYFGKAKLLEPVVLPKSGDYPVKLHMAMELDKSVAEMAVAVGIAALMNNINLKVRGEASGSMGLFRKSFEVDHSEKIDWNQFQEMAN
ncbi:MAG: LEA type 2 family protein [Salibacteraceae bacterium]